MPTSNSLQETEQIAAKFAEELNTPLICLYGEIGSGKTTFTKAMLKTLVHKPEEIKSPTYTYIRKYDGPKPVYHLDLYRVAEDDNLFTEELNELFEKKDAIIIIEWAEKIANKLPKERTDIHFKYLGENSRQIDIS